jgi:hypothetical protein
MKWISVDERTPKTNQIVLVLGNYKNELGCNKKKRTGLVAWVTKENSDLLNQCYYCEWVENITHWCEIPEQPKQQ